MKKVLIAYVSLTGRTKKMAEYIAEGVRFAGQEAIIKKTSDLKEVEDLAGYDGYIFGSPTYHRDMAGPMKNFLFVGRSIGDLPLCVNGKAASSCGGRSS